MISGAGESIQKYDAILIWFTRKYKDSIGVWCFFTDIFHTENSPVWKL